MEIYLLYIDNIDSHYNETPAVMQCETEERALDYLTDWATVKNPSVRVKDVYKVNMDYGTMKKMEAKLTGFRLSLVEKQANGQR